MAVNNEKTHEVFDLLILTDATASMGKFIDSLTRSLPEIISISALTGCFSLIGVLAYRDYDCHPANITEWSGWCAPSDPDPAAANTIPQEKLLRFAAGLSPMGGADIPEAAKTGLAHAHEVMRPAATTIIIVFADAPPHFSVTGGNTRAKELKALDPSSYSGFGAKFADWVTAARTLTGENGGKKAKVYSLVERWGNGVSSAFTYLSTVTGGLCFEMDGVKQDVISQLTIGILLAWMGAGKAGAAASEKKLGVLSSFMHPENLARIDREADLEGQVIFANQDKYTFRGDWARTNTDVSPKNLDGVVGVGVSQVPDFSKRYAVDEAYKLLVTSQMRTIIETNVTAFTVNPVFGTLWRTVCNDRANPARDELTSLFGLKVDQIRDEDERGRMKTWLAESYDFAGEIAEMISKVDEAERFPCVYLDPTQDFTVKGAEGEDAKPLNEFRRDELLDIGRSCDFRTLRRLGKVLTRLSYVEKGEDLPQHIHAAEDLVPRIPLALAKKEHDRSFWRVLLHAVLPGTMLARRPSALLAALTLRMGIHPLREVADAELFSYRNKWNTLEVPETWSLGCLNLLLDADTDFSRRVAEGTTKPTGGNTSILEDMDRVLFKTLVDYKMLELNLKTTLTARLGWTPDKSKVSLGPWALCRVCQFPRSVTVMGKDGVCGLCACGTDCQCLVCVKAKDHDERLVNHVSKADDKTSEVTWVECGMRECRAQYVVYNPQALNVRAKCFYCRHGGHGKAPCVECKTCRNRVIFPEAYRPAGIDVEAWTCPACDSGRETIIDKETSAMDLRLENGDKWLLKNDKGIQEPFNARSLFYTASHSDLDNLPQKLTLLPGASELVIQGKPIHNVQHLVDSLRTWVLSRRTESGQCSLCFSDVQKNNLRSACGRRGCHQTICDTCRTGWYGLNAPGCIINVAALECPFCRRMPAPNTIARYGITRLGDARLAVEKAGEWIYAWCRGCGFAKEYAERVCANAVAGDIQDWACGGCEDRWEAEEEEAKEGRREARRVGKECPACGVMTQKVSGCDHISCPCGAHWCYACGEKAGEDTIYRHMADEHGGLWGEEWDGEQEWDDEEDEEDGREG